MYPAPRTVCRSGASKSRSILARRWLIWVSTILVFGSKWNSQTCSKQHLAGDDAALAAQEIFKQAELARLQIDGLAATPHGAREEVHFEVAGPQHGRRRP